MKKVVKFVLKFIGILLLFIVVALLALPLWVSPVVTGIVGSYLPGKLGVNCELNSFHLNPYTGKLSLSGLLVENPDGYDTKEAISVGHVAVELETMSLFSDVIVINNLEIGDVFASYENGPNRVNNFEQIGKNASGEGEKKSEEAPVEEKPKAETDGSKRVIIDRLAVSNVKAKVWGVTVPMPGFELKGLGRKSQGVMFEDVYNTVSTKVLESLSKSTEFVNQLGKQGLDLGRKGIDIGTQKLQGGVDALNNQADKLGKKANQLIGDKVDKLGKGAGELGDKASDALKKSGDSLKEVGDSLKGLFK